jgi:hypothetical protein
MRRLGLAAVALLLAGCGHGGGSSSRDPAQLLAEATARTAAAHTARISARDVIDLADGGHAVSDRTSGVLGLEAERARITDDGLRQIVAGPVEYEAFFFGQSRPWYRRTLGESDVTTMHHLRFMLYLPTAATDAHGAGTDRVGGVDVRRVTARVDPSKLRDLPSWLAPARRFLVGNDYDGRPFDAEFWIDGQGRLRRIEARLTTVPFPDTSANVTLELELDDFGTALDVTPPPRSKIATSGPPGRECVGCSG